MKENSVASNEQKKPPRLIRALQQTGRRASPHGIISVRFLLPTSNPHLRLHRDLRLSTSYAWRVFFTVTNLWLLLRWLTWSAWRAANNAVQLLGSAAQAAGAPDPVVQRHEILRLALLHSVPPRAWYQYQLWKNPRLMWSYVYDTELPQFHQFYNGNVKGAGAKLLADKWLFAQRGANTGITIAPTLAQLQPGQHDKLMSILQQHEAIFCKPRFGSASRGAFAATLDGNALTIKLLQEDKTLQNDNTANTVRTLLARTDYIIQPLLINHGTLQALCETPPNEFAEAISLRLMSRRRQNAVNILCAYLEIPRHEEEGAKQYALIAIDNDSGMLRVDGDNWHYHQLRYKQSHLLKTASGLTVPHWQQVREQAMAAHALVDDINVVAWDFVITDNGAVLLEGNINWRVSAPQILFGPLLPLLEL